jgi:NitT/TauT family transport system substrate-binding protein
MTEHFNRKRWLVLLAAMCAFGCESKREEPKLDIVQMADFPSVLGATALKAASDKVQSLYISTLSGGIQGAGNAIVVPLDSKVQSLSELKGKKLSVPFGSTAHAMLIRAVQDLGWVAHDRAA